MNRAERRRAEKESAKKQKTLIFTQDSLNELIIKEREKAVEKAFEKVEELVVTEREDAVRKSSTRLMYCMCMILHDKYGFGHDRCLKAMDSLEDMMDAVMKGYVNFDDITNTVHEELKIVFTEE